MYAGTYQIKMVKEYKFIGVTIDNDLRFNKHVNNTLEKALKRVNILKCMSTKEWGNSVETQRKLNLTYVRSVLEYASPCWNGWVSKTTREKLQKIQNQALRAITNMCKT